MLVALLPDGTRRGIPSWMFDAEICANVQESIFPFVDIRSLLHITEVLEMSGYAIPSGGDEPKDESRNQSNDANDTISVQAPRRRNKPTNSTGK
ncbi:hypothetical protein OAM01_00120 [bacterium]|nr:hypothetical protein [bacterium]